MTYTIGEPVQVLDKGHITLRGVTGNDWTIVEAARVSIGAGRKGENQDKRLISYLMRHRHETPLEMADISLVVKCPIFVARQWMRHRMASYNEISGRYVELKEEVYIPENLRGVSTSNKQGSGAELHDEALLDAYRYATTTALETYRMLLDAGVAREMARAVLPVATYTEFWCKMNLRAAFNFVSLRNAPDAQHEIRIYAEHIEAMIAQFFPVVYEAWKSARSSTTLTAG
ncbi:MAG: FAD-dependent thymidylate synthase [Caulobacteraceae bacterium]|nr:FAD-dependent thymidylate synthase [Caulobacteraceae bacterium]